jgi:hypothetical protein
LSLDQYLSLVSDWEEAMAAENHAWRQKKTTTNKK